ncbi:hypothetical protein [Amycolatopsis saalfeldensis]|uniref:hypothetical protein n=1 Tax=Amycolatopsis saalfeldensis TaxID=394193 RepID=UPI000B88184A|nr:hypothetical protein [Amycolatopsis saalfeldensis]
MTILALASPRGGGKTHTARALLVRGEHYVLARGAVTRPSRGIDDNNDVFLTREEFRRREHQFCLRRVVGQHLYGYDKSWIDKNHSNHRIVVLPLATKSDVSDTSSIWPHAIRVYVRPTIELLRERLTIRHLDDPDRASEQVSSAIRSLADLDSGDWDLIIDVTDNSVAVAALVDALIAKISS